MSHTLESTRAALTSYNKEIAYRAQHELIVDKDISSIDRYFAEPYIQHNPALTSGLVELRKFKAANVPLATSEILRCFADGDLVFLHERVTGLLPVPLVFFDIYRMDEGKIVEHWDTFSVAAAPSPSGHTAFDGPTEVEDVELTDANRALVLRFVNHVFIAGLLDTMSHFVSDDVVQHTEWADGIDAWVDHINRAQWFTGSIRYRAVRRIVAEGNFVVTGSEGTIGGAPHVFNDMWRVENGKIVEHWAVMSPIAAQSLNGNPAV